MAVWGLLVMVVLWLTYYWHWSSTLYKAGNAGTAAAIPGISGLVGAHFVSLICGVWARRTLGPETHSPPRTSPKRGCLPLSRNLPFSFTFLLHSSPLCVRTVTHPPDLRRGLGLGREKESITQIFVIASPVRVFCCNFVTFSGISLGMNLTKNTPSTYMSSFRF